MFSHNLKTSVLTLLVALPIAGNVACGSVDDVTYDPARDESFLALMGSTDGKADGLRVEEDSSDARAVLQIVNEYAFDRLADDVGLDRRLVANLVAHRGSETQNPYDTLVELDATPWTTMEAFVRIWNHAHEINLVGASSFCQQGTCYDVTEVALDLTGELTFDVGREGWWVRSYSGGRTVREARGRDALETVATSTFDEADVEPWVVRRADGSLTAVTRSGQTLVPERGSPLELGDLQSAVAAAYDANDELFVAAAARDASGVVQGLVIFREASNGWVEEFKQPLPSSPGTALNARFVVGDQMSLWVDVDQAARRYSRTSGQWRESMVLDMEESGFGAHPDDRVVTFHQRDGMVFVHRATWNFSRRQEVVRVEDNMVTAVIDLPTAARTIAPHADHSFSIVYADGSLAHMRDEDRDLSSLPLGPATPDDLVRTFGDDIYVLQGATLRILRAR